VVEVIERCPNVFWANILLSFGSDIPPDFAGKEKETPSSLACVNPFFLIGLELIDRGLAKSLRGSLLQSPYFPPSHEEH
jgi:hypothetical protein